MRRPDATGFVLAGGRSSRMGADKAELRVREGTLLEHVVRQVESAVGSATVVGGVARPPLTVLPDVFVAAGPLGGIVTALRASKSRLNLIVACDMPSVEPGLLKALVEKAAALRGISVIAWTGPRIHPLCAVYERSALPVLEDALERGIRRVGQAIELIPTEPVEVDPRLVLNINTPDEWLAFSGVSA